MSINVKSNIFFYRNFVLFVPAQDNVQYTLIGMGTGPQYFSIDPRSGSIRIRETLKDDPLKPTNYTVNILYCGIALYLIFPTKRINIQKCNKCHGVKGLHDWWVYFPMRHLSIIHPLVLTGLIDCMNKFI